MRESKVGEILTLCADKVLDCCEDSGNAVPGDVLERGTRGKVFFVDLSRREVEEAVVLSRTEREENAFFYQLRQVKRKAAGTEAARGHEADSEKAALPIDQTDIVYVDFKTLMHRGAGGEAVEDLFRNLYLKGADQTVHLVPFDRSASMSRQSVITFINEKWKEELDQRLSMGIFELPKEGATPPKKTYALSKYYAYRGLYLSTGRRMKVCANAPEAREYALCLDEKSVVVIPDVVDDKGNPAIKVFTEVNPGKPPEYGLKSYDKKHPFSVNCFDGEGLISPDYAKRLQAQLGEENAQSFQIRMPFIKGVLHTVDFLTFFKDEFKIDPDGSDKPCILDVFGKKRQISGIKIVLTASMCKVWRYLKDNGEPDPVQWYFKQFYNYDHALYVLRTDTDLSNPGHVRLNYQFLNTTNLTQEKMNKMVRDSLRDFTHKLETDQEEQRKFLLRGEEEPAGGSELQEDGDPEEDKQAVKHKTDEFGKFGAVLKKNPSFIHETKIRNMIRGAVESQYIGAMNGSIIVNGEHRFLSGDLLYLLRKLVYCYVTKETVETKETGEAHTTYITMGQVEGRKKWGKAEDFYTWLQKGSLGRNKRFYAPQREEQSGLKWDKSRFYAVLRNPHLSRNEQCAMRPYVAGLEGGNNLYEKYFSHLTGVLMLPYASPVAARLGGADFDGDLVKVIDNKVFNESAQQCFTSTALVEIPSGTESSQTIPKQITFSQIKDVFDSKVGQLSNLAVKFGLREYNENVEHIQDPKDQEKYKKDKENCKGMAARCCILVGQEIDKAKTGKAPYVKDVMKRQDKLESVFFDRKEKLPKLRFKSFKKIQPEDTRGLPYYQAYIARGKTLEIEKPAPGTPNLEAIMYTVLDFRATNQVREGSRKFVFVSPGIKLDPSLKIQLTLIMTAYFQTMKTASALNQLERQYQNAKYKGRVYNIVNMQYDGKNSTLYWDNANQAVTVDSAVIGAYRLVTELHKVKPEQVKEIFDQVRDGQWQYCAPGEREEKLREFFERGQYEDYEEYEADFESARRIFCNFRCRGYTLLYFVLKDVLLCEPLSAEPEDAAVQHWEAPEKRPGKMSKMSVADILENALCEGFQQGYSTFKPDETANAWIKQQAGRRGGRKTLEEVMKDRTGRPDNLPDDFNDVFYAVWMNYQEYCVRYYTRYAEIQRSKRDIKDGVKFPQKPVAAVNRMCREDIEQVFKFNMVKAARYWCELRNLDRSHTFLWAIFTAEEILSIAEPESGAKQTNSEPGQDQALRPDGAEKNVQEEGESDAGRVDGV